MCLTAGSLIVLFTAYVMLWTGVKADQAMDGEMARMRDRWAAVPAAAAAPAPQAAPAPEAAPAPYTHLTPAANHKLIDLRYDHVDRVQEHVIFVLSSRSGQRSKCVVWGARRWE
ncbi:hypothetical protein DRB96_39065 [Streptomyces sp. ICC1]|nr:hypothetical protein DRB96_39065 [Streptomyces sp. ICC1]